MKELVRRVAEVQKNVKVAQTKLLRGRQQIGRAGGGQEPRGRAQLCSPHPGSLPRLISCPK